MQQLAALRTELQLRQAEREGRQGTARTVLQLKQFGTGLQYRYKKMLPRLACHGDPAARSQTIG